MNAKPAVSNLNLNLSMFIISDIWTKQMKSAVNYRDIYIALKWLMWENEKKMI